MPTTHSGITVAGCSDPAYIPHHLLQGSENRPQSRLEQLVEQARIDPRNLEGRLPHRVINQGPVFWLADPLTRAVIMQVNGVVLGSTKVLYLDLHSACAGVIALTHLQPGDDQRPFQTGLALEHGQDFADLLAILAGHEVEVRITYTQFADEGREFEVFDVAVFTGQYRGRRGRAGITSMMPAFPLVRTSMPVGSSSNGSPRP